MELRYTVIDPTKNITLLVTTPVPRDVQPRVAAELLRREKDAEQVGFAEGLAAGNPRLQMMGGEFCGNASISAAALMARKGGIVSGDIALEVSGADEPLCVKVQKLDGRKYLGTVAMPLPVGIETARFGSHELPVVQFPGISHVICDGSLSVFDAEANIRSWCEALNVDALGLMFLDGSSLKPYVYVRSTDTAVWESSCASGSTACAAYLAARSGEAQTVVLQNPCGELRIKAELSGGALGSLLLTGSAEITGKHLICT